MLNINFLALQAILILILKFNILMKKSFFSFIALSAVILTACNGGENGETPQSGFIQSGVITKSGVITSDDTWTSDKIYQLSGRVVVGKGTTLTIEPGTIIKAEGGRETNASVLIVARGGQIQANGSPDKPIIFTSLLDEIQLGQVKSPNLDESYPGLWGGVIILGNAQISAGEGDTETQIEGIPPSDQNGLYGGSDNDESSGSFTYVSIRYGGTLIGDGNEINGLTLGGVGSATTVNHVEVFANLDDGIECFGGSVNIDDVLVWFQGDDAYDLDQSYNGTIDNFIYMSSKDSDHALEIDGPEGSFEAGFTMTNGICIGWNNEGVGGGEYADFRDGARGSIGNVYFSNFSEDADFELDDEETSDNYINGILNFSSLEVNVSHLTAGNLTVADIFVNKHLGVPIANVNASIVTVPTVGINLSEFRNWTLADALGKL